LGRWVHNRRRESTRPRWCMGYVYVLSNPAMPGLVKIGCTDRSPQDRVSELSASTGVPTPFVLEVAAYFLDHSEVERELHTALAEHRVRGGRESFSLSIESARRKLMDKRIEVLAAEIGLLDPEDRWRLFERLPPEWIARPAPVAPESPAPASSGSDHPTEVADPRRYCKRCATRTVFKMLNAKDAWCQRCFNKL